MWYNKNMTNNTNCKNNMNTGPPLKPEKNGKKRKFYVWGFKIIG